MEASGVSVVCLPSSLDIQNSWNQATSIQYDSSTAIKQDPKNNACIMHLPWWAGEVQCCRGAEMAPPKIHSHYSAGHKGGLGKTTKSKAVEGCCLCFASVLELHMDVVFFVSCINALKYICIFLKLSRCISTGTQWLVIFTII